MGMKGETEVEDSAISSSLRGCLMPAIVDLERVWISELRGSIRVSVKTKVWYSRVRAVNVIAAFVHRSSK